MKRFELVVEILMHILGLKTYQKNKVQITLNPLYALALVIEILMNNAG
jgi:hypothetical protein